MAEPAPLILHPDAPAYGGAMVAREGSGQVTLVTLAIPGETVLARPTGRRGGAAFARTVEVLRPSDFRVTPRCPHFGTCGGCAYQHIARQRQLEIKREVVAQLWARNQLRLPPDAEVVGMDDPWRYRIRGEFEFFENGGRLEIGFHAERSHRLVAIGGCPIHDQRIERAALAFRDALAELRVVGAQNVLLTVEPNGPGLLWSLRMRGRGRPAPAALPAMVAERLPDLVLLDDSIAFEFWDLHFRVRSATFIQTNYRQMLELYRLVLEMLAPASGDRILDVYSGIGTIGIAAARSAARVTCIEENPQAVQLGALAARINRTGNVEFVAARAGTALAACRVGDHEAAVVDPPRAGLEPEAVAELLRLGPDRIVYVSCDPATQARDLAALVRGGYRVRRAALVDMFPQTYHIETVVLLERG